MPSQEPKHLDDERIRQGPVARWENEGGATSTGHEPYTIKTLYMHVANLTKKLIGMGKMKKASPETPATKQP